MGALGPQELLRLHSFCLKTGHRSLEKIRSHLPRNFLTVSSVKVFTQ